MLFDDLARLSPFPIVQFKKGALPKDGILLPLSSTCRARLSEGGEQCRAHYKAVSGSKDGTFTQCPFGFTTLARHVGPFRVGVTGLIGFPRFQSDAERAAAKKHADHRVARLGMSAAADALNRIAANIGEIEQETVKQHSMALHEIRKLNGQVKQTAERLCLAERPDDPDAASPDLVKIFKTSELMSRQFDVIEILANEELARLPLNSTSEPYKIFDKCARIYRTSSKRIFLDAPPGYTARLDVCDKTFPIIPSVLIENALKYSKDREVRITFLPIAGTHTRISVTNVSAIKAPLTDAIFERGYRGTTTGEGSGNGLYVAQLVAVQHGTRIELSTEPVANGLTRVSFVTTFRLVG